MIELEVSSDENAKAFLLQSKYVPKKDLKSVENLTFVKRISSGKHSRSVQYGKSNGKTTLSFHLIYLSLTLTKLWNTLPLPVHSMGGIRKT